MPVKPKVKREDFSNRIKEAKKVNEKVVKCGISNRILIPGLQDEIDKFVENDSITAHRASLVFNRLINYYLSNNLPLPNLNTLTIYNQCYTVGNGRPTDELIKKIYQDNFKDFPVPIRPKGITSVYYYSSVKYQTSFSNYLVYTFTSRQKFFIKKWCEDNEVPVNDSKGIIKSINGWNTKYVPNECSSALIAKHRELLNNPLYLNENWLKANLNLLPKYYSIIEGTKKHLLTPLNHIVRRSITIDNTILANLLHNIGYIQKVKDFDKTRHWEEAFSFPYEKGYKNFKELIDTDGVSVSFHYTVPKVSEEKEQTYPSSNIVAIDPGRCNLLYAVRDDNQIFSLTKHEYYHKEGMYGRKTKTSKWESKLDKNPDYKAFKNVSLKEDFNSYVEAYKKVYEYVWSEKLGLKWARERFRGYCLKNKVVDQFFRSLGKYKKKHKKITVAYGDAKFNATAKHEISSLTTSLFKRCSTHYNTVRIDEFRTTIMCSNCECKLDKVCDAAGHEIRGLKRCSTECFRILNRDKNAAYNILKIYRGLEKDIRPEYLSRPKKSG